MFVVIHVARKPVDSLSLSNGLAAAFGSTATRPALGMTPARFGRAETEVVERPYSSAFGAPFGGCFVGDDHAVSPYDSVKSELN
jgi:hypothetical protein